MEGRYCLEGTQGKPIEVLKMYLELRVDSSSCILLEIDQFNVVNYSIIKEVNEQMNSGLLGGKELFSSERIPSTSLKEPCLAESYLQDVCLLNTWSPWGPVQMPRVGIKITLK